MPDATFEVSLARANGPSSGDTAEFMIAPNPGVHAGPLRDIASGGELSRVMLALMVGRQAPIRSLPAQFPPPPPLAAVDARVRRGGRRASEGTRHAPSGNACASLAAAGRCSASPTCHRSPHSARATSPSSRTPPLQHRTRGRATRRARGLSELVRMLGAPEHDPSARRHASELRKAA